MATKSTVIRPDADPKNADWCKKTRDVDAATGKPITPKVVRS